MGGSNYVGRNVEEAENGRKRQVTEIDTCGRKNSRGTAM